MSFRIASMPARSNLFKPRDLVTSAPLESPRATGLHKNAAIVDISRRPPPGPAEASKPIGPDLLKARALAAIASNPAKALLAQGTPRSLSVLSLLSGS